MAISVLAETAAALAADAASCQDPLTAAEPAWAIKPRRSEQPPQDIRLRR
ncbi:hypothetical protein LJR009_001601 [Bosea sp. LjRoot9]